MGRYNKILVALDGSPASGNALRQALRLADSQKSWILATTVLPSYTGDLELTGVHNPTGLIWETGEAVLREARRIAMEERGMPVRTIIEEGSNPHEKIVELARAEGCDLIVLGRQGRGGVTGAVAGHVAARVIGFSPVDVLVVPEGATLGWGRILLATDGSRYSEAATAKAISFAAAYGDTLDVLSVAPGNDEFFSIAPAAMAEMTRTARANAEKVAAAATARQIPATVFVREGEPWEHIVAHTQDHQVDAIFMGSHGRTGIRRLLMGSVTERVIGHAPCPVIVVNAGSPP